MCVASHDCVVVNCEVILYEGASHPLSCQSFPSISLRSCKFHMNNGRTAYWHSHRSEYPEPARTEGCYDVTSRAADIKIRYPSGHKTVHITAKCTSRETWHDDTVDDATRLFQFAPCAPDLPFPAVKFLQLLIHQHQSHASELIFPRWRALFAESHASFNAILLHQRQSAKFHFCQLKAFSKAYLATYRWARSWSPSPFSDQLFLEQWSHRVVHWWCLRCAPRLDHCSRNSWSE